jgi:WXG100 family type VII secretion target
VAYTVSTVRNSKPDVLNTAATDAEASAQRVDAQIAQGRRQMDALRDDWTGTASDAAGKQYGELITYQSAYSDQLRALNEVLTKRGPSLVDLRSKLDTAVSDAEEWWDVADDGSVTPGFWLSQYVKWNRVDALRIEAKRLEIENNIKLLLAQFEAEDVAAGHEIRQIGRELT